MRLPSPRLVHPWLRAALALVLAGTFGFRVAATPAGWACMGDGAGGGPSGHAGHHEHGGAPASVPPLCVCIAHGSGMSVTVEPTRLVGTVLHPLHAARAAARDDVRPVAAEPHLLPFPLGPPALLA